MILNDAIIVVSIFSIFAFALSVIDVRTHTLPNRLVFASLLAVLCTQITICVQEHSWQQLVMSTQTAGKTLLVYSLLFLFSAGRLGMGDVKYSLPIGLTIGWFAPTYWLLGIWITFLLAALVALVQIARNQTSLHSSIPFGPFMSLSVFACFILQSV